MSVRREEQPETGPPLWSIGLAAALMLIVPIVLHSIAPAGPIREGDTVFTDGSMKVPLARPLLYDTAKFDGKIRRHLSPRSSGPAHGDATTNG